MNIFKRIKALEESVKGLITALRSLHHCNKCGATFLHVESKVQTKGATVNLIYGAVIEGKAYCNACLPAIRAEIKAIELFRSEYSAEKAKQKGANRDKAK